MALSPKVPLFMNVGKLFQRQAPFAWLKRGATSVAKSPEEPLDLPVDQRGGFYSGALGENLNSRYTLVQKLGWGQHSSVWLAKDDQCMFTHQPYVAIKILSAHATLMQDQSADELGLLLHIRESSSTSDHPGQRHIMTLIDDFELMGSYGRHICLVQPAMGRLPVLQNGRFPVPVVKSIAKQLLLALSFLHNECHIVHTDLKLDNILVDLDAKELPHEHKTALLGSPALSCPLHTFSLKDIDDLIQISKFNVRLNDFGTAATVDGKHADIIQPFALRAPEVIIGCGWGSSADIWNLGCLIFELLTGRWLFVPRGGPTWTREAYHLAHMPAIAGEEYDASYFRTGECYREYFTEDGELLLPVEGVVGLEVALKSYDALTIEEFPVGVSFLQSMLRLKPSDRASASDLIQHQWLKY